jgi:starch synthase
MLTIRNMENNSEELCRILPAMLLLGEILSNETLVNNILELDNHSEIKNNHDIAMLFENIILDEKYSDVLVEIIKGLGGSTERDVEFIKKLFKDDCKYYSVLVTGLLYDRDNDTTIKLSKYEEIVSASSDSKVDLSKFNAGIEKIKSQLDGNDYDVGTVFSHELNADVIMGLSDSAGVMLNIILSKDNKLYWAHAAGLGDVITNDSDFVTNFMQMYRHERWNDFVTLLEENLDKEEKDLFVERRQLFDDKGDFYKNKMAVFLRDLANKDEVICRVLEDYLPCRHESTQRNMNELRSKVEGFHGALNVHDAELIIGKDKYSIMQTIIDGGRSIGAYLLEREGERYVAKLNTNCEPIEIAINKIMGMFQGNARVTLGDGLKECLVMKAAPGQPLDKLLRANNQHGCFVEKTVEQVKMTTEALKALRYFHKQGLTHGDTLPANIFMDMKTGEMTFIDFGTSALMSLSSEQDVQKRVGEDIRRLSHAILSHIGDLSYDVELLPINDILNKLILSEIHLGVAIEKLGMILDGICKKDYLQMQKEVDSSNPCYYGRFTDSNIVKIQLQPKIFIGDNESTSSANYIVMPHYDNELRIYYPLVGKIEHYFNGRIVTSYISLCCENGKTALIVKPYEGEMLKVFSRYASHEQLSSITDKDRTCFSEYIASALPRLKDFLGNVESVVPEKSIAIAMDTIKKKTNIRNEIGSEVMPYGFTGENVDELNNRGLTPLTMAMDDRNIGLIRKLLALGASLTMQNIHGNIPLTMIGGEFNDERGSVICALIKQESLERKLRLQKRAEKFLTKYFDKQVNYNNKHNVTALTVALDHRDEELAKYLLEYENADPEMKNNLGKAPMEYVLSKCSEEMKRTLELYISKKKLNDFANKPYVKKNPKVLHASLEFVYGVGGLKAAATGLIASLNKHEGQDVAIITPYWDFLDDKNEYKNKTIKLGSVNHIYKGKVVTSDVYGCLVESPPGSGNEIIQYLVRPEKKSPVGMIFDIREQGNVYKSLEHSEPQNRVEYYNGAIASFIKCKNDFKPEFDLYHTHGWQTGLSQSLIKEFEFVRTRLDTKEVNKTPTINHTIHMLMAGDVGRMDTDETFKSVGLDRGGSAVEQQKETLLSADTVNLVAKGMKTWVLRGEPYSCGYAEMFAHLNKENRLQGITNGIEHGVFYSGNERNLDGAKMEVTFDEDDDVIAKKRLCKQYLNAHMTKYLSPEQIYPIDLDKPMLLYVGRYSDEKGIDMLKAAAIEAQSQGMQMVIMGIYSTEEAKPIIQELKEMEGVIVLDKWQEEQRPLGRYFREAADFTIVPSHAEACGLVPMEAMSSGSIPITSNVQGLPDVMREISELGDSNPGTGFIYNEESSLSDTVYNMEQAIKRARSVYDKYKNNEVWGGYLKKIIGDSKNFSWSHNAANEYSSWYQNGLELSACKLLEGTPDLLVDDVLSRKSSGLNVSLSADSTSLMKGDRVGLQAAENIKKQTLHVSLEYGVATLGGLGTVVTQLVDAQNRKFSEVMNYNVMTPLYSKVNMERDIKEHCIVKHMFNGHMVDSNVYMKMHPNGVKQFYIDPVSQEHKKLFSISSVRGIYSDSDENGTSLDRIKYFDSAVAAYVASISEVSELKVDMLQAHGWHTGLIGKILKDQYPESVVNTIFTIHVDNSDHGCVARDALDGLGLKFSGKNGYESINVLSLENMDKTVMVSNELKKMSTDDCNSAPNKVTIKFRRNKGKLVDICNGITHEKYSLRDKVFQISETAHVGFDTAHVHESKQLIKKHLFEIGGPFVGARGKWRMDPEKPIVLFIGRYSGEKGTDMLEKAILSCSGKANFIAIGRGYDTETMAVISKYSKVLDNVLVVFSEDLQKKYGEAFRACADIQLVPSHSEACGLVAMEAQATGAIIVAADVGGLKDVVREFNSDKSEGVGYRYTHNDTDDLKAVLDQAIESVTSDGVDIIQSRIMEESISCDWSAKGGAVDRYQDLYSDVMESKCKLLEALEHRGGGEVVPKPSDRPTRHS